MKRIYVLHENPEWISPLEQAFAAHKLPWQAWNLNNGAVFFEQEPPKGVFYNRMSASAHTRGNRFAPDLTFLTLNWLEKHGRRIINGSRALQLELSKIEQYAALEEAGVKTPKTAAVVGKENILSSIIRFTAAPFILKPNRGGKGAGVQLFYSIQQAQEFLNSPNYEEPVDGVWLIQEYIASPEPFITRCEFIGGKFLYAARVDTSDGFELCPADACNLDAQQEKFRIVKHFERTHPELIKKYETFLRQNKIEAAGIEFIRNASGKIFTYDVNTNTNYNSLAESRAKVPKTGMEALAQFLGKELRKSSGPNHLLARPESTRSNSLAKKQKFELRIGSRKPDHAQIRAA